MSRPTKQRYDLRLYVSGATPRSIDAIATLKSICQEHLEGRYDLEVIDVREHPQLAKEQQLTALPLLVKRLPRPLRQFIGNLADEERVLMGLDVHRKS